MRRSLWIVFLLGVAVGLIVRGAGGPTTVAKAGSAAPQQGREGVPAQNDGLISRVRALERSCDALKRELGDQKVQTKSQHDAMADQIKKDREAMAAQIQAISRDKLSWGDLQSLEIASAGSGKVLDVPLDKLGRDGTLIQQFNANGGLNQRWKLRPR